MRRALVAGLLAVACGNPAHGPPKGPAPSPAERIATGRPSPAAVPDRARSAEVAVASPVVRVALEAARSAAALSSSGDWRVLHGADAVAQPRARESWAVERSGRRLRLIGPGGATSPWSEHPVTASPASPEALLEYGGRRYRGELVFHATDTGTAVINRVPLEDYLRGVVPLEIGRGRTEAEFAAIEAQAVVARSFAISRIRGGVVEWDLRASAMDQVYGGVQAETRLADRAVAATAGMVLRYGGRAVNAPYHSTCGGRTAAAEEVWRTAGEPWLRSVVDQDPRSGRSWCEVSPRFRYSRSWDRESLRRTVEANIGRYASSPRGGPGAVRSIAVLGRTPSGRVAELEVETVSGARYRLRGNDIRFVLRTSGNELLESTSFDITVARGPDGAVSRLDVEGSGFGHGVGMCQWGAIARARAGWDFRSILEAYFPGTQVGPAAGG